LFLPVTNYARNDLWNLRGSPTMFYYVMLAMSAAALLMCRALLRSRIGYYWLAIREDEQAARALGNRHVPLQDVTPSPFRPP